MRKLVLILLIISFLFMLSCEVNKEMKIENEEIATFAGGCFWCIESVFDTLDSINAVSGYAGGDTVNPTYEEVSSGKTGHMEAVQIHYDSKKYTYQQLVNTFLQQINPTDENGQFADRGSQYQTAIFYHNNLQKTIALDIIKKLNDSGKFDKPITVQIIPFKNFYMAEEYHQDYAKKRAAAYKAYKKGSGREDYIKQVWGDIQSLEYSKNQNENNTNNSIKSNSSKISTDELKEKLTDLQYKVTQENGTEKAFENEYWDEKRDGIYVDLLTGEPLFSSTDKYDSGTGWPSFTKPINKSNLTTKTDFKLILPRTEVRSSTSHLGHVFDDGPQESGGKRYCLNSAALRFIPKEDMEKLGYGEYLSLFDK